MSTLPAVQALWSVRLRAHVTAFPVQLSSTSVGQPPSARANPSLTIPQNQTPHTLLLNAPHVCTHHIHSHSEESLPAPHYPRCSVLTPGCVQPSTPPRCEREQLSRSELPGLQRGGGGSGGRRGLPRRNAGLPRGQIRLTYGFPALDRCLPRGGSGERVDLEAEGAGGEWELAASWFMLAKGSRPSLFLSHFFSSCNCFLWGFN
jgi:hypothetical protein